MSTTSAILMSGWLAKTSLETLQALIDAGLAHEREKHHVPLPPKLLNHAPSTQARPASRLLVPIKKRR